MNSKVIVKLMTNLINKKFYSSKDEAISKLDVYYAMNRISEEEYAELVMLAEEVYAQPVPEEPEESVENPETINPEA